MDYGQVARGWCGAGTANGGQSKKQVYKADVMRMVCILRENGTVHGEKGKTMTNADRIRAMTDEELAEWLVHTTEGNGFDGYEEMVKAWNGWLKREVEDATND